MGELYSHRTQNSQNSKHVPSVRICEICGRTSSACLFCRRVDPTQPKQFSHRFHSNLLAAISSHRFHKSAQNLLVEKGLPQIARIYTDVGGYGIPAIPTQTPNYLPTEATEPTEVSDARYSTTDCTDVHRLGGYGIPATPTQTPNYLPTEPYAA